MRTLRQELRGDIETPLSIYWKLAHDAPASFLLESVTGGEQLARYSLIGARPRSILRGNGLTWWLDDGIRRQGDPLAALRELLPQVEKGQDVGLPRFCGGAVGYIGYDYARTIERLPDVPPDPVGTDEVCMLIAEDVVVFDHARSTVSVIALSDGTEEGDRAAEARIATAVGRIQGPLPSLPPFSGEIGPLETSRTAEDYMEAVRKGVEYIHSGDFIQIVPSVRFSRSVTAHPVTVYRSLRALNPSPYMFLLRTPGTDVVGASPELLVGLEGRTATVRPIAGTRPRSEDEAEDRLAAESLLADEKERAEHVMLVDLGRNDLGRVCKTGSVLVDEMMQIERYSHVMHIVSSVRGQLQDGLDAMDLVRATFPAGTLSGAPKVRAMQVLDELEPVKRGIYGGALGYFSANGDLDLAIAIRTAVLHGGRAHVQAGAGVVADSRPEGEWKECNDKARAVLRALELAHGAGD
ncbi:MAG: anthranilate synthase component I [Fimbriimonadaceae bacterium]|nr:anthranilate synthase component I [Fimbriimonadaceae bacterium]